MALRKKGDSMLKEAKLTEARSLLIANTCSLAIPCRAVTTLLNWSATSAAVSDFESMRSAIMRC